MVGSALIDRIGEHFERQRKCLEVPEWGESPDKPLKVYATPLTLAEKKRVAKMSDENNEATARIVILKCTDADGERLFQDEERATLMAKADARVLERICFWIADEVNIDAPEPYIEEAEKN